MSGLQCASPSARCGHMVAAAAVEGTPLYLVQAQPALRQPCLSSNPVYSSEVSLLLAAAACKIERACRRLAALLTCLLCSQVLNRHVVQ